jgi:hypothetical protein
MLARRASRYQKIEKAAGLEESVFKDLLLVISGIKGTARR